MPGETQTAKIKWHPVKVKPHIVTAEDLKGGLRTYADVGEKIFLADNPPPETKVYLVTSKRKKLLTYLRIATTLQREHSRISRGKR